MSATRGVLEPLQTATSVDGQVDELRFAIESRAQPPVVLVGHSWGAWLGCIVAATFPCLVRKLILIGSGPLKARYVPLLRRNRLSRLTPDEQQEFTRLADLLAQPGHEAPDGSVQRLGEIAAKTDTFEPNRTGCVDRPAGRDRTTPLNRPRRTPAH